jgi:hypothetical protein
MDCIIFDAVSVAEERFITATHRPTGQVVELDNRTLLYGHYANKTGGWIETQNKLSGNDYYKAEDFEIVDGQRARPFRIKGTEGSPDTFLTPSDGAKKIIDDKVELIVNKLKAKSYFGFTGTGDTFRNGLATLLPYKGQREDMLRPLLLDEMKQYVCDRHNCTLVAGIEADDAVSMATVAGYKAWKASGNDDDIVIAIAVDKDAKGTSGFHFNPNKDNSPRLIEGFGKLWLTEKGDVDGEGRMFFYYQIAVGDTTDNYKSNCFSDAKFGSKGGYNALKDCTNDAEAFTALVGVFKKLYPKPKTITTFRGEITIDAMYVFQEMASLAFMLRWPNDKIDVKAVCDKLGVKYA